MDWLDIVLKLLVCWAAACAMLTIAWSRYMYRVHSMEDELLSTRAASEFHPVAVAEMRLVS